MNKKLTYFIRSFMRISTIVVIWVCLGGGLTYAERGHAQRLSDYKLNLSIGNESLHAVLTKISEQTRISFAYDQEAANKVIVKTADYRKEPLDKALQSILIGTGYQYEIVNRNVVISKKPIPKPQKPGKITGRVTDAETGEPLEGVTIQASTSGKSTLSDATGNYVLELMPGVYWLSARYVGYEVFSKAGITVVENQSIELDISLTGGTSELDEVVVVGYGTQAKRDLTGAYSTVSANVIKDRKATQLSTVLQGTMSGVMVTRTNNAPGASSTIRLRGITSIGNSNPLIIVDGIYMPNIDDVNPADVESITVLKDAASAAIYGSRAAAGVILITTKRGKKDEFALNYSVESGLSTPTANPEYVDVIRYMEMENELRWNDAGNGENQYPTYPVEIVGNYYNLNQDDPDAYPITDWEGLILKQSARRQTHNLSVSGGSNVVRTNASFVYDYEDGLYKNRTYDRISTRINNDFTISNVISASADVYFKRSSAVLPISIPNELMHVMPAIYPAIWVNGGIADGKGGENPYAALEFGGKETAGYAQVGGKINLNVRPLDGLSLSGSIAPKYNFNKGKAFTRKVSYASPTDVARMMGEINGHQQTNLLETRDEYKDITYLFTAEFAKEIAGNKFNLMGGYESFYSFSETLTAGRDAYELHDFPYLDVGPLTYRDNSGSAWEVAYRSYFGRLSYNYKDRYLFQANVRTDGSSRFQKDYRWGTFPSFSVGWTLSEEPFMPKIPALSFLKLRASWGTLGNDRIGNYPYQSTIAFNNGIFYQGNLPVSLTGAALQKYAIRDISWEKTSSLNLGLNVGLFDDRLQFVGDIYDKQTKDMLLELEIPDYIGYENPDQNTGKMRTKGFDLEVSWKDNEGAFSYAVSANLSDFRSRIGELGGIQFLGDQVKMRGSEFDEWYGYVSNGLFQTADELTDAAKLNNNVKVGDIRYVDISGPDGSPDGKISPEYDKVLLGGSLPRYTFGANFYLDYKGIDFSFVLQGVGKQQVRKDRMSQALAANYKNIPAFIDGRYWSHYHTPDENLQATYPRLSNTASANNYILSDFWMFNGGYLRVKAISIGYTIPADITGKFFVKSLRLYSAANDLFCFNRYPKGWDPEMAGISSYPITTSFVFGLSARF